MARVIGIDFGNWMTYVCSVKKMDEETHIGGNIEDLISEKYNLRGSAGIPNVFYWNATSNNGVLKFAEEKGFSVKEEFLPRENHLRLLKKHIGESVTLYGYPDKSHSKTFSYDDIITKMFEYHIQLANETLRTNYGEDETTNLISITFPAKLRDPVALKYFIDLAEKADSGARDTYGNMLKIKVVGAVCEPAAAGLDRLSEVRNTIKGETVTYGVFDLGGGTFDLAIVSLYPNGKTYPSGKKYYYDLVCEGQGLNVAGSDFSNSLEKLLIEKATEQLGHGLRRAQEKAIKKVVESCKFELSDSDSAGIMIDGDFFDDVIIEVTRQEFEDAIKSDVDRIMNFTRGFFDEHNMHRPDEIIMTGGSSWIPYIKRRLEETLPEYRGRIALHRPSKGAAYGAARFYSMDTSLERDEMSDSNTSIVRKVVEFDLATKVTSNNSLGYIMSSLIKKGDELPCDSGEIHFNTSSETSITDYNIYVATKDYPDINHGDTDYKLLQEAMLRYGKRVAKGTNTSCRLKIDSRGAATLEAWMDDDRKIAIRTEFRIDNATDDSSR